MSKKYRYTRNVRLRSDLHDKLRDLSFTQNISISQLLDQLVQASIELITEKPYTTFPVQLPPDK